MNFWDIFHLLLLAASLQGIILAMILWRSKGDRQVSNRWLAAILLFFSYHLTAEVLRSAGVVGVHSWTYHVVLEYNWIYGALIYFYVSTYIDQDFKFERKHWIHFVPVLLEFMFSNYVKIQNFYWDGTRESLSWLGNQAYMLWMHTPFQLLVFSALILYYVLLSRRLLNTYTAGDSKPVQKEDVEWIELVLTCYRYFAIVVIAFSCLDYLFFDFAFNPFYKFPVNIGMAILTYWLALQGYSRRDLPYLQPSKAVAYAPLDHQEEAIKRLYHQMESEQYYKNPSLTLSELATQIDVKSHELTQILNRSLNKNFSDFVNEYRVQEAIKLINDPDYVQWTLLAIAFESGFNSKASFNRIIKKFTGKTPKALRDKV
jgi:AraC-like DNA-binding protein